MTYEGIAKVARAAVGKKRGIFKGIFAAIRGRKNKIIFLKDIIKIGYTWVVGSDKYGTVVGFLVLVVESVFGWDIESFVDLCFDLVYFFTRFFHFLNFIFHHLPTGSRKSL